MVSIIVPQPKEKVVWNESEPTWLLPLEARRKDKATMSPRLQRRNLVTWEEYDLTAAECSQSRMMQKKSPKMKKFDAFYLSLPHGRSPQSTAKTTTSQKNISESVLRRPKMRNVKGRQQKVNNQSLSFKFQFSFPFRFFCGFVILFFSRMRFRFCRNFLLKYFFRVYIGFINCTYFCVITYWCSIS